MRTKTLLSVAAALAASAFMAQAQVYSVNIVGYVNKAYPAGFSMASNPLDTGTNTVANVLPNMPDFGGVYKYAAGSYEPLNTYFGGGFWGNGAQELQPGEGFFINSPSAWTNTYVGEVVTDGTNSLIAGFNMVGSIYPAGGGITTALQLAPNDFDGVYEYIDGSGYAALNTYFGGGFWGGGEPTLEVGQGIFYNAVAPIEWAQSFTP